MGNRKQPQAKSTIDPKLMQLGMQNYQSAQNVANRPFQSYTGKLSPDVPQATTNAIAGAQGVMGYQPQQVTAPTLNAPKARAATVQQVAPVTAQTGLGGMAEYSNPYTQEVINASLSDLDRARQISQVGNAQQSTMGGGAFGGSRLGVQEAETNKAYLSQAANMAANLRNQGFNTSAGLMQSDYDRTLAAQQGNQGIAAGRASQIGAQNQATNLANLGVGSQYGLAGGQMGLQSQLANQSSGLQGAGLNLSAAGTLGGLGSQQFGMESQGLNAAYQEFLRQQGAPYQNQALLNSSLGAFGSIGNSQQYVQPNTPFLNMLAGGLGGIAQGVGYGLMR